MSENSISIVQSLINEFISLIKMRKNVKVKGFLNIQLLIVQFFWKRRPDFAAAYKNMAYIMSFQQVIVLSGRAVSNKQLSLNPAQHIQGVMGVHYDLSKKFSMKM
jgi:hypothetical protein